MIPLDDALRLLEEFGPLKKDVCGLLPTRKPTHGSCCTCQDCGEDYDDCVCSHNECWTRIQEILARERGERDG